MKKEFWVSGTLSDVIRKMRGLYTKKPTEICTETSKKINGCYKKKFCKGRCRKVRVTLEEME